MDIGKHDIYELIKILEDLKKTDPDTRFAYAMDLESDTATGHNPNEPKLDRMIIQTPMMHRYYQQYSDVVFMDATYKTNKYDLHLTILSGVSSENKNVILAIAFV